jgi:ribosome modulation factor
MFSTDEKLPCGCTVDECGNIQRLCKAHATNIRAAEQEQIELKPELAKAYDRGFLDYIDGVSQDGMPYSSGCGESFEWYAGWRDARAFNNSNGTV